MTYLVVMFVAVLVILMVVRILPKSFELQREIIIDQAQDKVVAYTNSLKNMTEWNIWDQRQFDMDKTFHGNDSEVGFTVAWKGGKVTGEGEQEITALIEDKENNTRGRKTQLRFYKPIKVINNSLLLAEKISETQTRVTMSLYGTINFPSNIIMSPAKMDRIVGADFEQSLINLKALFDKTADKEVDDKLDEDAIKSNANETSAEDNRPAV